MSLHGIFLKVIVGMLGLGTVLFLLKMLIDVFQDDFSSIMRIIFTLVFGSIILFMIYAYLTLFIL